MELNFMKSLDDSSSTTILKPTGSQHSAYPGTPKAYTHSKGKVT